MVARRKSRQPLRVVEVESNLRGRRESGNKIAKKIVLGTPVSWAKTNCSQLLRAESARRPVVARSPSSRDRLPRISQRLEEGPQSPRRGAFVGVRWRPAQGCPHFVRGVSFRPPLAGVLRAQGSTAGLVVLRAPPLSFPRSPDVLLLHRAASRSSRCRSSTWGQATPVKMLRPVLLSVPPARVALRSQRPMPG